MILGEMANPKDISHEKKWRILADPGKHFELQFFRRF